MADTVPVRCVVEGGSDGASCRSASGATLRVGELAAFLPFGTNDLTQMTYRLSRDDVGRFMRACVGHGQVPNGPFHTFDLGVMGELMLIAARRGWARNPSLVLGLCGEHGSDPASVRFCKLAGFDCVPRSPSRMPIARRAAAQARIPAAGGGSEPR